jgi:hypothetical protein
MDLAITSACTELRVHTMSDVVRSRHTADFAKDAPHFAATFRTLLQVMSDSESNSKPPSRPGTSGSGGSKASKDEANVRSLCSNFIMECLAALGESLQCIQWDPQNLKFYTR